jgi:hypothetical protein
MRLVHEAVRGGDLELLQEFTNLMLKIERFPLSYPIAEGEFRRALMHRFPYSVFYRVEGDTVFVMTLMHNHGDPDVWLGRV